MFGVAALTYFTAVYRHRVITLRIIANIVYAVAGAVAIGGVAVGRYVHRVGALYLRAFLFGISSGVNGRFVVREVGFFFGE